MTECECLEDFGINLKSVLRDARMSQTELAEILGISKSTMSKYIHGECMPSLKMVINIMDATCCSFYDLVYDIEHVD